MKNKLLEINPVYEGKFLKFYNFLLEDGRNYEVVSRREVNMENVNDFIADAVDMMIISEDYNHILIIKEWRTPINDYIYAFPAGLREANEDVVETAKRELFEETGLKLLSVEDIIGESYSAVGFSNEKNLTIVGTAGGVLRKENDSEFEEIIPAWYTKEEVAELLKKYPFAGRTQAFCYMFSIS